MKKKECKSCGNLRNMISTAESIIKGKEEDVRIARNALADVRIARNAISNEAREHIEETETLTSLLNYSNKKLEELETEKKEEESLKQQAKDLSAELVMLQGTLTGYKEANKSLIKENKFLKDLCEFLQEKVKETY